MEEEKEERTTSMNQECKAIHGEEDMWQRYAKVIALDARERAKRLVKSAGTAARLYDLNSFLLLLVRHLLLVVRHLFLVASCYY